MPRYVWRVLIYVTVLPALAGVGWYAYYRHVYQQELRGGARARRPVMRVGPGASVDAVRTARASVAAAEAKTVADAAEQKRRDEDIIRAIVGTWPQIAARSTTAASVGTRWAGDTQQVVAILPAHRPPEDPAMAAIQAGVADLVAIGLSGSDRITVVDRSTTQRLLAEHRLALSGAVGEDYAVQAGRLLGAWRGILVGVAPEAQGRWRLSATCYDIDTGRAVTSASGQIEAGALDRSVGLILKQLEESLDLTLRPLSPDEVDQRPELSLHYMRAMSDLAAGEPDRAMLSLMRINQLDPSAADAYYWKGVAYSRMDEPDHAKMELERYLQRAPDGAFAAEARSMLAGN